MSAHLTASFWARLVRIMRDRTRGVADAEDLVQEAYIRLASRTKATPVLNPEGFLIRTAWNLQLSEKRREKVRSRAHADETIIQLLAPPGETQDEVIIMKERLRVLEAAIAELPPRAREVFLLNRLEELSYTEIARNLGISASAVEKNMARALTHLALRVNGFGRGGLRRRAK